MDKIELIIWGMRGEFGKTNLVSSVPVNSNATEFLRATEEIRLKIRGLGLEYYSIEHTKNFIVFAKYRVLSSRESVVSVNLFIPKDKTVVGGQRIVLDRLMDTFASKYITESHEITKGAIDKDLFLDIISQVELEDQTFTNETLPAAGSEMAYYVYDTAEKLDKLFDYPFHRALMSYKRVLLLSRDLFARSENSFNSISKIDYLNVNLKHYNIEVAVESGSEHLKLGYPYININGYQKNKIKLTEEDEIEIEVSDDKFNPTKIEKIKVSDILTNSFKNKNITIVEEGEKIGIKIKLQPKEYELILEVVDKFSQERIPYFRLKQKNITLDSDNIFTTEAEKEIKIEVSASGYHSTEVKRQITDNELKEGKIVIKLEKREGGNGGGGMNIERKKISFFIQLQKNNRSARGSVNILVANSDMIENELIEGKSRRFEGYKGDDIKVLHNNNRVSFYLKEEGQVEIVNFEDTEQKTNNFKQKKTIYIASSIVILLGFAMFIYIVVSNNPKINDLTLGDTNTKARNAVVTTKDSATQKPPLSEATVDTPVVKIPRVVDKPPIVKQEPGKVNDKISEQEKKDRKFVNRTYGEILEKLEKKVYEGEFPGNMALDYERFKYIYQVEIANIKRWNTERWKSDNKLKISRLQIDNLNKAYKSWFSLDETIFNDAFLKKYLNTNSI